MGILCFMRDGDRICFSENDKTHWYHWKKLKLVARAGIESVFALITAIFVLQLVSNIFS